MKKIVIIGGGTGVFNALTGLKDYPLELTSIVSTMDSGGSTGILRDEYGVLPPGDIRRSLIALSDSPLMRKLFEYRFEEKGSLKGHSFGNLFITALTKILKSDEKAILKASEILRIKGKVLPVTLDDSHLFAKLTNGNKVHKEHNIGGKKVGQLFLTKKPKIFSEAKKAIMNADLIILGPGDFYTSILPNILVSGVKESIKKSKAKTVFVCNIMTKGETKGFTAEDYVNELKNYLGTYPDQVLMNNKSPPKKILARYKKEGSELVQANFPGIKKDFLKKSDYARHDPKKLAKEIYVLAKRI
ncbi:MAG: gluconeogenesis factor YvcK family protein [archaeon]